VEETTQDAPEAKEPEELDERVDKGLEWLYGYIEKASQVSAEEIDGEVSHPYFTDMSGEVATHALRRIVENSDTGLREDIRRLLKEAEDKGGFEGLVAKVDLYIAEVSSYAKHQSWAVEEGGELYGFIKPIVLKEAHELHGGDFTRITEEELEALEEKYPTTGTDKRADVNKESSQFKDTERKLTLLKKVLAKGTILKQILENQKLRGAKLTDVRNEAISDLLNQAINSLSASFQMYEMCEEGDPKKKTQKERLRSYSSQVVGPIVALSILIHEKEGLEA